MKSEIIDIMSDRRLGFITKYAIGKICCSVVLYGTKEVCFYNRPNLNSKGSPLGIESSPGWQVNLDSNIEELDIYHSQYGISVSEEHACFFIGSWIKGLYCCDINSGKLIWFYHLKHCNEVYAYRDYLVARFAEIGLRKLSYDGNELGRYTTTTSNVFSKLEEPYVFVGAKRDKYYVLDTRTMNEVKTIPKSFITNPANSLLVLDASGTPDDLLIVGFENDVKFEKRISL